jgi:hydrogenase maturation protease
VGRRVVLGVGNLLLRDEGVGIHVVKALAGHQFPPDVEVIDGATAGCDLLPLISGADRVVIVDALEGGEPPGAVYRLTPEDFDQEPHEGSVSLHDIGITDVLKMLKLMEGHLLPVVIVGIEPGKIEVGLELTPEVAASLPFVLELVIKEITVQEPGTPHSSGRAEGLAAEGVRSQESE